MNDPIKSSKRLFFIALLPPQEVQDQITPIKKYFATHYHSRHALKSPPHITLYPPFEWELESVKSLKWALAEFAILQSSVSIQLCGFAAFPPRVIYIHVQENSALVTLQKALMNHLKANLNLVNSELKKRGFKPHLTVAFRDLTPANFDKAWAEFQHKSWEAEFLVSQLTLLCHQGGRWHIDQDFPFQDPSIP